MPPTVVSGMFATVLLVQESGTVNAIYRQHYPTSLRCCLDAGTAIGAESNGQGASGTRSHRLGTKVRGIRRIIQTARNTRQCSIVVPLVQRYGRITVKTVRREA